jgi:hypothetical protein
MDIDNTKRKCYALCPRKYYWEYCLNLRPTFGSTALRFGQTWHSIMEAYYGVIRDKGWDAKSEAITVGALAGKASWDKESKDRQFYTDYRTLENCLSAFMGHITNYADDEHFLEVIEVEKTFSIPISSDFNFTGKIDGKVRLNGATWLMEHKTTGMPIDRQLKTLLRDPQVIGYTFAGMQDGDIEGILIPMLHVSSVKSKTTGNYGKTKIEYRRSPQIFTQGDINSWLDSLLWTAHQIQESISKDHWPMQLDSCYHFGACTYTSLCEQNVPIHETNTQNFITVKHWNVLTEGKEDK